jgi:ubiquinone/menaquinone biosynthesis C-methylase UbiE
MNKPLPEVASIIEKHGWGHVEGETIVPDHREEQAMTGLSAKEFSDEAKLHHERYEHIADMVKKAVDEAGLKNPFIVDIGCGPGVLTYLIAKAIPTARIIGADLSEDMLAIARQNAQEQGVSDRVTFATHDASNPFQAEQAVDIVVSRNMLHRLPSLEAGLMAMAKTTKDNGGIVMDISFRNLNDLSSEAQAHFVEEFNIRNDFPRLQEAWVFALLNAPTLAQYESAAKNTAEAINAKESKVTTDHFHEVYITLKKL